MIRRQRYWWSRISLRKVVSTFRDHALVSLLLLSVTGLPAAAQSEQKFSSPILVTSSGQALDAFTVKTLLGRAGVKVEYDPKATDAALNGVKTVIIAVGASNKGFGQAGITAETELARSKAILDTAKAKGISVICVHIGGAERRKGLSVQFIDLVCPVSNQLVVSKEGNADDHFSKLAKEKSIPLTLIEQPLDVGKALASLIVQG
jgi:hypothetical protein